LGNGSKQSKWEFLDSASVWSGWFGLLESSVISKSDRCLAVLMAVLCKLIILIMTAFIATALEKKRFMLTEVKQEIH